MSCNAFAHTKIAGMIRCAAGHKAADQTDEGLTSKPWNCMGIQWEERTQTEPGSWCISGGPTTSEKQKCLPKCYDLEMMFFSQLLQWLLAVFSRSWWYQERNMFCYKQSPPGLTSTIDILQIQVPMSLVYLFLQTAGSNFPGNHLANTTSSAVCAKGRYSHEAAYSLATRPIKLWNNTIYWLAAKIKWDAR